MSCQHTDAVYPFVVHSWARVADALQQDFNPFVPDVIKQVMPHVMNDVTVQDQDRPDTELIYEDDGYKLYLDHNLVDLKKHAFHLLAVIGNFCPPEVLPELMKAFEEGVEFSWDPHVNQCAVLSLIAVVASAKRAYGPDSDATIELFKRAFTTCSDRIRDMEDTESGIIVVNCLKSLVRKDHDLLRKVMIQDPAAMPTFISNLVTAVELWGFHFEQAEERIDNPNNDEYSKEFIREDLLCYDAMAKEIALLVGEVLAMFGDDLAGIVNELVASKFDDLWNKEQLLYKRTVIYLISDFVENISAEFLKDIFEQISQALITAIAMDDPGITQAAFNALGVIGSKRAPLYNQHVDSILNELNSRLGTFPRDQKHRCARDNCVAAIIKTAHTHSKADPLLKGFTELPITCDRTEAKICHAIFARHLQQNQDAILGSPPDEQRLLWVVNLFLSIFQRRDSLADVDTINFIAQFIMQVSLQCSKMLESNLSPDKLEILKQILSSTGV